MEGQVKARKIRVVVQVGEAAGMPRGALLDALGIAEAELADPEAWLPQLLWRAVWEQVIAHTGDEALALRAAARVDRGYFAVVDYVARSSPDLASAIRSAVRYFRLSNTQGQLTLTRVPEGLWISRHLLGDEGMFLPRQAAEFALATMVRVFRGACAGSLQLSAVTFRYPPPADPAPFREVFRCPVRFSAPHDALLVGEDMLALPMAAPDRHLKALIERHGDALLAALPPIARSWQQQVRAVLARELAGGHPGIDGVAARLGVSRRSLQRHLAEEGVAFRELCDEMRREMACSYLQAGVSVGEVAFLLGYAEVSPFHRAFKRWTGHTPGDWRQRGPDVNDLAPAVKVPPAERR